MWADLKRTLSRLTPEDMAAAELRQAELALLEAQSAFEHASAIATYNERRCERLRKFLKVPA